MGAGHEVLAVGASAVAEFSESEDDGAEQTCAQVFVWTARHGRDRFATACQDSGLEIPISAEYYVRRMWTRM